MALFRFWGKTDFQFDFLNRLFSDPQKLWIAEDATKNMSSKCIPSFVRLEHVVEEFAQYVVVSSVFVY